MNARNQALAAQDTAIEESRQRALASREAQVPSARRMSAMESMSTRLGVSEGELTDVLVKTVFAGCRSKSEFLALIVVSNEYKLNPLTKEIYAFPSKGGGVVPMVSVDGWITLMNSHPMFDGIDFVYHNDKDGKILAIESVIYRKDRSRPVKVIEYLEECKRNTDPWNKTTRRMLRHRALIQGVRVAFGFSGIYSPDDDDLIDAEYTTAESVSSLPQRAELANEQATGTQWAGDGAQPETVDQVSDAAAPLAIDASPLMEAFDTAPDAATVGTLRTEWIEQSASFDRGQNEDIENAFVRACKRLGVDPVTGELIQKDEPKPSDTVSPSEAFTQEIIERAEKATSAVDLVAARGDLKSQAQGMEPEQVARAEAALDAAADRLTKKTK